MPISLQTIDPTRIPLQETGRNAMADILRGYKMAKVPGALERQRIAEEQKNIIGGVKSRYAQPMAENAMKMSNLLLGLKQQYAPQEAEADLTKSQAMSKYYSNLAAAGPGARAGGRGYAPTQITKLMLEKQDIDEGFLPGSNRTVPLTPEQQQQYSNRIDLQMQKTATDAAVRNRSLFANNLVQSIDNANVDDLVMFSGPKGAVDLKKEQTMDLIGKPTERYLKHKEAVKAVALEAQELRQFLGTSITPQMDEALRNMVDATSITTSPIAAKRMIEKSRGIIKKQMRTYQEALKSTSPYIGKEEGDKFGEALRGRSEVSDEELLRIIGGG